MASPITIPLRTTLTSPTSALLNHLDTKMSLPATPMKATKPTASAKSTPSKSTESKGLDNDVWTLLFAAHPTLVPNFKAMAAVDEKGRTASQFEHQLRKHRQAGKELAESKATMLEGLVKKNDGGAKKRKSVSEEGGKTGAVKKGKVDVETDDVEGEESPVKKAKVVKKGTAKVVKKRPNGGTKPKATPKVNPKMNGKAKKGKEVDQAEDASGEEEAGDVDDTGIGEEEGDVEEDDNEMMDMKFER